MTGIWCNKWLVCSEPFLFWPKKTRFSVTAVSLSGPKSKRKSRRKGLRFLEDIVIPVQSFNLTHLIFIRDKWRY